jgi:hypothetical protein
VWLFLAVFPVNDLKHLLPPPVSPSCAVKFKTVMVLSLGSVSGFSLQGALIPNFAIVVRELLTAVVQQQEDIFSIVRIHCPWLNKLCLEQTTLTVELCKSRQL